MVATAAEVQRQEAAVQGMEGRLAELTAQEAVKAEEQEARHAELAARFDGQEVPLPEFWGGLRLVPETVEFWQGRNDRLHDRLRFRRTNDDWVVERLSP
jgi:pyridoxamine 5'-phosphate oxidase